jgi:ABC-type phosphate transport system permease subunit
MSTELKREDPMTREESLVILTSTRTTTAASTGCRAAACSMPSRVGRCRRCNGLSSCCSSPWASTLAVRALPIVQQVGVWELLSSQAWHPTAGQFGLAPFIAGSVVVTSVAMLIAVVPAILSGVYLAEYTTTRTRGWLKPLIDLLVGIPSVVYGLWGILFIVPLIREQIGPLANGTLGQVYSRSFGRPTPAATVCWPVDSCWR